MDHQHIHHDHLYKDHILHLGNQNLVHQKHYKAFHSQSQIHNQVHSQDGQVDHIKKMQLHFNKGVS